MSLHYDEGESLPDVALTWLDTDGNVIDFSSGWVLTVNVAVALGGPNAFTKTDGITGAATAPNVVIAWDADADVAALTPGRYTLQVVATRDSDGKVRTSRAYPLWVHPRVPVEVP